MTNIQDIRGQIAATEAIKRQAQQAEALRISNEQVAQRTIAQADSEIQRLKVQAQNLAIEERIEAARQSASAIEALKPQLLAALNARDIPAAITIGEKIAPALEMLVKHNAITLEMSREPLWQQALQQARTMQLQPGQRTDETALGIFEGSHRHIESRLPVAPNFLDVIRAWVQAAPGGKERQIREGVSYALTGWLCNGLDAVLGQYPRKLY